MFSFREPITYGLFLALLGFFNDFSSAHEKATVLQCVVLLKLKMPWMLRRGKRFHLSSKVKNHVSAWICRHTLVSENHHQMIFKKCIFLPWKSCWIIAIWIMALFTTKLLTNSQNWKSLVTFFETLAFCGTLLNKVFLCRYATMWTTHTQKKPSEMEVAPRCNCWHCRHCWH